MFARALELTTRPGKLREVIKILRSRMLPMLRAQPGFVDEFILAPDAEPDRVVMLSLWTRHQHAEWFHRHHYGKIREELEPLLEFEPVIRTFNVENDPGVTEQPVQATLGTRVRPA